MALLHFDCIERPLSRFFYRFGKAVARYPIFFMLPPILATLLALTILRQWPLTIMRDTINMYTPATGRASSDKQHLIEHFAINDSNPTYYLRRYEMDWMGWVLVTSKTGPNVLEPSQLYEATVLWRNLRDITVYYANTRQTYENSLCIREHQMSQCVQNPMILIFSQLPKLATIMTYPRFWVQLPGMPETTFFVGNVFGGVEVNNDSVVQSAHSIMLPYMLHWQSELTEPMALAYEQELTSFLKDFQNDFINVDWWTYDTMQTETRREVKKVIMLMAPLFLIVTVFTFLTSLSFEIVRSKPWAALGGCASAMFGIGTASAFVMTCGLELSSMVFFMPFIVFSIGVDDIYVLLAAWRRSPAGKSVEDRMAMTFRDAGVSITVTSLTNILSFAVGCSSQFPSIWMFCVYATVANVFVYVYQMTLFAGIMVYSGRREAKRMHPFQCHKVRDSHHRTHAAHKGTKNIHSLAENISVAYNDVVSAIRTKSANWGNADNDAENDRLIARFFHHQFSNFLLNPIGQVGIILVYAAYLAGAIVGILYSVKVGLNPIDVLPQDSYARPTLQLQEEYFVDYNEHLHVWFDNLTSLDLNLANLKLIEAELDRFENTDFSETAEVNWIKTFTQFVETINSTSFDANATDDFVQGIIRKALETGWTTTTPVSTEVTDVDFGEFTDDNFGQDVEDFDIFNSSSDSTDNFIDGVDTTTYIPISTDVDGVAINEDASFGDSLFEDSTVAGTSVEPTSGGPGILSNGERQGNHSSTTQGLDDDLLVVDAFPSIDPNRVPPVSNVADQKSPSFVSTKKPKTTTATVEVSSAVTKPKVSSRSTLSAAKTTGLPPVLPTSLGTILLPTSLPRIVTETVSTIAPRVTLSSNSTNQIISRPRADPINTSGTTAADHSNVQDQLNRHKRQSGNESGPLVFSNLDSETSTLTPLNVPRDNLGIRPTLIPISEDSVAGDSLDPNLKAGNNSQRVVTKDYESATSTPFSSKSVSSKSATRKSTTSESITPLSVAPPISRIRTTNSPISNFEESHSSTIISTRNQANKFQLASTTTPQSNVQSPVPDHLSPVSHLTTSGIFKVSGSTITNTIENQGSSTRRPVNRITTPLSQLIQKSTTTSPLVITESTTSETPLTTDSDFGDFGDFGDTEIGDLSDDGTTLIQAVKSTTKSKSRSTPFPKNAMQSTATILDVTSTDGGFGEFETDDAFGDPDFPDWVNQSEFSNDKSFKISTDPSNMFTDTGDMTESTTPFSDWGETELTPAPELEEENDGGTLFPSIIDEDEDELVPEDYANFVGYIAKTGYNSSFDWSVYEGSIDESTDLADLIKDRFLWVPLFNHFTEDIRFTEDGRHLAATRFLVRIRHYGYTNQTIAMHRFQDLADGSRFGARVFNHFFLFAMQNDQIVPSLLQNIAMATGCVMVVSLLMIPNPFVALWVCASLVSINAGIIGYGSLLNVTLDFASMTTIVMAVGFCVDYTAHVAYHFAKDEGISKAERVRHAMHSMGLPILQSAISTIIGISILLFVKNYVGYSFVKTIVLAIVFASFHGLFVLPVLLTLMFCEKVCGGSPNSRDANNEPKSLEIRPTMSNGNQNGLDFIEKSKVNGFKENDMRLGDRSTELDVLPSASSPHVAPFGNKTSPDLEIINEKI